MAKKKTAKKGKKKQKKEVKEEEVVGVAEGAVKESLSIVDGVIRGIAGIFGKKK
ncbi:MAG: hypothetical protein KKA79_09660 [Nanoarchaeota archaeon]|nr:hypothetical protein [Nanoarchaeota archaeon]